MEIHQMEEIGPGALWEDFKFGLENLKEVSEKIGKVALVTDKGRIKKLAGVFYAFIPGINLKSFAFEEIPEAKKWVSE